MRKSGAESGAERQRIERGEDHANLRLFMAIQPFDNSYGETKNLACQMDIHKEDADHAVSTYKAFEKPYAWRRHFQGFDAKRAQEMKYGMSIEDIVSRKILNVADFSPMNSPYVPGIILVLVNAIETHCIRGKLWSWLLCEWQQFHAEALDLLGHLLFIHNHVALLRSVVEGLSLALQMRTLRLFLSAFSLKLVHFFKRDVADIIKRPLYDQFLRPNPRLRHIVRHALLPYSRTTIDTAAFLMLHLQHFLAFAHTTSNVERALLAKIYGPLLISFSERPIAINKTTTFVSEEASLLETILEVCDATFWNHIAMLKIGGAFDNSDVFVGKFADFKKGRSGAEIYQRDFKVRDFVDKRHLLGDGNRQASKCQAESFVARQTFILDALEGSGYDDEEDVQSERWTEADQQQRQKQQPCGRLPSVETESSLWEERNSDKPNGPRLIPLRSNEEVIRDLQRVYLRDSVGASPVPSTRFTIVGQFKDLF